MKQPTFKRDLVTTILAMFLLAAVFALPGLAFAQEKSAEDANMDILREKLKADKKLLVAANMSLTDAEAKGFWPVYEEYQKELQALNVRIEKTIESYAAALDDNTLTDEKAKQLIDETLAIDQDETQMRKAFATKLAKALPSKKVARYLQIENKIRALLRYEIAAEIPLVE